MKTPHQPAAEEIALKYCILEKGHAWNENTLHSFSTAAEREKKTVELIYGDGYSEGWDKYKAELEDTGWIEFEGDPGLEWFTAHVSIPAPPALSKERDALRQAVLQAKRWHQGDKFRFSEIESERAGWESHMDLLNAALQPAKPKTENEKP